ncbi:hypothetical protein [Thioclava sp. GXIMD4216]|uniref:HupE / UreJ protein n=1 Tax=Thioclava litoralis TaxID=3076557 RepID=A0ABZ1DY18_9RHOB|nr:hypothetical protein RPE78_09255 [Thioclava sp. FTW29]
MKRLAILAAFAATATPALAHPGHPTAPGPFGHEIAHLLMAAVAVGAVYLVLEAVRKVFGKSKED